jgi:two-component system, sensor histidine kinase and response regulator
MNVAPGVIVVPALFRATLDALDEGIVLLDAGGRVVFWNRWMERTSGLAESQVLGQALDALYPEQEGGRLMAAVRWARSALLPSVLSSTFNRYPLPLVNHGKPVVQSVHVSPVELEPGHPGSLVRISDETLMVEKERLLRVRANEIKQALKQSEESREAMRAAKEVAEEAARVKSDFLANMSHEIRTPLNAVLGFAQIGQRENTNRRTRHLFDQMLDSGQLLLGIINDILDFSKIEAGKLRIESEPLSLNRLIEHVFALAAGRALDKGIILQVEKPANLPAWVEGDLLRLSQVLGNLISNAIKFTEQGQVVLAVSRSDGDCVFQIRDSGIGMTEEQIGRLFTAFQQADNSTTRRFGGTGLGLAISKQLVDLMGGTIHVTSQPGLGSTFEVRLPLKELELPVDLEGHHAYVTGALPPTAGQRLTGYRILAAEDNPVNQLVLEDMLTLEGAHLSCVEDGLLALDLLQKEGDQGFDIVLTDIQMPRMDGHQLAQALREHYPTLPVVGLTAHAMAEERKRCFANGMVDHVTKPIELETLVAAVNKHARRRGTERPGAAPIADAAEPAMPTAGNFIPPVPDEGAAPATPTIASAGQDDTAVIDWAALQERFNGRQAFIDKLVATTLANIGDKAAVLRAAAARGDYAQLAFVAHGLKAVGGNMKASQIHYLGAGAESAARAEQPEALDLAEQLARAVDTLVAALAARATT